MLLMIVIMSVSHRKLVLTPFKFRNQILHQFEENIHKFVYHHWLNITSTGAVALGKISFYVSQQHTFLKNVFHLIYLILIS